MVSVATVPGSTPASAKALMAANKKCASMNKVVVIQNMNAREAVLFQNEGSATLLFGCVDLSGEGKTDLTAAHEQCKRDLDIPELDPIRQKVELSRKTSDAAPPFAIAANDTFPTDAERPVIAKWATIRDACISQTSALVVPPPSANAMQSTVFQQDASFGKTVSAKVGELIVALYQQKLTYGEFAQKRYEIGRDATATELAFRQSTLERDQARQLQVQELAQQEFAARMTAWAKYMESVNARQPQTVNVRIVP
jgi:hypothetical protein